MLSLALCKQYKNIMHVRVIQNNHSKQLKLYNLLFVKREIGTMQSKNGLSSGVTDKDGLVGRSKLYYYVKEFNSIHK